MLLKRLKEYNERLEPMPPNYVKRPVPWLIELDDRGNFLGFTSTSDGSKKNKGKEFVIPDVGVRSSNIKPGLLTDKAEYVLNVNKNQKKHQAFIDLVKECAEKTAEPSVAAVYKFLTTQNIEALTLPKEIKADTFIAFTVGGTMPTDLASVKKFWADSNAVVGDGAAKYQCVVCGKSCVPVKNHPKVKPIPYGQSAGLTVISANSAAYESYGLERSNTAPTCQSCAEGYAKGANALLKKGSDSSLAVGPIVYIFWTKEDVEVPFLNLLTQPKPDPAQVKALLSSAYSGQQYNALDDQAFYAAALSAGNARVVVRDWLETTVGRAKANLARWFQLQKLIDYSGEGFQPLGVFELAASLYRTAKEIKPNIPKAVLRPALKGGQLPYWLLYQAVRRNRAEQKVTRARLALIKMVLLSKYQNIKEDYLVQLDTNNNNPAYLCGRLLAELESIQKAAINPNSTIVERYYGTASSSPASVMGHLLKGAQAHLAKLRKEKPWLQVIFQQRLEEIQSRLSAYPKVLNLEEQAYFALGYYHQRADDRKTKPKETEEK